MTMTMAIALTYKYLQFVNYRNLLLWDIKRLSNSAPKYRYDTVPLKDVLSVPKMEWVEIEDEKEYPILGVHAQGEGVYINRVAKGRELTMKQYQRSKPMHLFYCKVRTVNGQWGIVYPEFADSYGSSNMQYLAINQEKLNPTFLEILLRVKTITQEWDKNAVGADGRHFPLKTLLNLSIPLPSLKEQNEIVAAYNNTLALADQYEQQAVKINNSIETYLLDELGLNTTASPPNQIKSHYKYLHFANNKDLLDRWDIYNVTNSILNVLEYAKYPIKSIGNAYDFVTRTWRKSGETFQYVELGDVSPLYGITKSQTLATKKAPSRATQTIQAKDLIIGTTRPYLKRFAIVTDEYTDNVCSSGFQVIEPNTRYNLQFLYEFLMTEVATKQFEYYMTGALYPAITNKDLRKIQIPLPPLNVQNEIVAHIKELKEQIKSLRSLANTTRTAAIKQFEQTIFE